MNLESPSASFPFQELLSASSIIFYQCEVEDEFLLRFISSNVRDILGIESKQFAKDETL